MIFLSKKVIQELKSEHFLNGLLNNESKFEAARVCKKWLISSYKKDFKKYYHPHRMSIGDGATGRTIKAETVVTGETRAIKIMSKDRVLFPEMLIHEVEALKVVDHPNIVKLYETFEDEEFLYLVMEYHSFVLLRLDTSLFSFCFACENPIQFWKGKSISNRWNLA